PDPAGELVDAVPLRPRPSDLDRRSNRVASPFPSLRLARSPALPSTHSLSEKDFRIKRSGHGSPGDLVASAFLRLDRRDQSGRCPGAGGEPGANAERSVLGDLQPAGLELAGVRARVADVGDQQLAALLEHPGRFAERPRALPAPGTL